ncbi:hypothetical protein RSOL_068640 [Rhizoctonia solani AG-3 Rhs1AP]|uniref:Uncharacterized protein n=2 Tax=Rhizoctonia solani AG-3 TaxID=1086053 RepID=X8IZR0_9AGAM|nr:hypothetical protein RSOL_068640 [Rhizoctonia solani AG-3 Rhs1AP]
MTEDERSATPTRSITPASGSDDSDSGKKKHKAPKPRRKVIYKLAMGEKGWIKPNFTKFVLKIGRRGAKGDTARAYCTNNITPRFMVEFYKQADLDDEETKKTQYEADYAIYVYLSNLWKKERKRIRKLDGPDDGSAPGPTKFHPQYYWADAHGEEIAAELEKKIGDQPSLAGDVGLWRHTVSELFKAKSPEEQSKWKNQAEREKAKHKVVAKAKEPLSDKEKMLFIKDWCGQMESLVKLGESRGGIQTLIHFGTPDVKEVNGEEKKIMKFTSYTSKQSSSYTRTKDFNDGEEKFGHYVAENMGAWAERCIPIAITPADDGAPVIPELPENPVLSLLRALVRSGMKAHWLYAAGQGKVPWTEISQAIAEGKYDWITKDRLPTEKLPSGKRVRFVDPGDMTIDECLIWLRHLKRRQLAGSDTSMNFQFQQVYATRTHVFPEWTKSHHKQPTRRAQVDVYVVQYKGYLDRPETYDPIPYDDNSWDYFYRDTGKAGLIHWVGLPSRPKAPVPPVVSSSEVEAYQNWFDAIKETQEGCYKQIFSSLDLVNRLDRGISLIAQDELWRLANQKPREVPLAIPQNPPPPSMLQQWLASPWVVSYLLAPHEMERTGSPTFFEDWQHRMRSGPLYHPLSKTYRGGRLGLVWVIRGILKHLATVGAAAGVLKLPKEAPTGSDFSQLTLTDWDRAVKWLAAWHSLLEEACQSLELTVRERQKPAIAPSSENDSQPSIGDGGVSDTNVDHTMEPVDEQDTFLPPRAFIPRKAKVSASYLDPYIELDKD